MRNLLAALSLLVAGVTLYQGLVLRGLIDGPPEPVDADTASFVLIAAGVMLLAAVMVRWSAGIAAVEMALAGIAVISIGLADHAQRYLTAYGGVAVAIALAAMAVELWTPVSLTDRRAVGPPLRAKERSRTTDNHLSFARMKRVQARRLAPNWQERVPPWLPAHQLVPRIDAARARREAERRQWRAWCAAHRPSRRRPTGAPAAVERASPSMWSKVDERREGMPGAP